MKILVSPSLLSFDFSKIAEETRTLLSCGADLIHCDVMGGDFVPNITFGMKFVADLVKSVPATYDVHLMISSPEKYIEQFAKAGSDIITIHYEATSDVAGCLTKIRSLGKKAGLSIKPNTPVSVLQPFLHLTDLILIMTVEPGFGGQGFIDGSLSKISQTARLIGDKNIMLEIDGGINFNNIDDCLKAGANIIVAGNTLKKAENLAKGISRLRGEK